MISFTDKTIEQQCDNNDAFKVPIFNKLNNFTKPFLIRLEYECFNNFYNDFDNYSEVVSYDNKADYWNSYFNNLVKSKNYKECKVISYNFTVNIKTNRNYDRIEKYVNIDNCKLTIIEDKHPQRLFTYSCNTLPNDFVNEVVMPFAHTYKSFLDKCPERIELKSKSNN